MNPKTRVLVTLIVLGCIDVVLQQPTWFTDMVRDIYGSWHG